jgi:hypothetical protein
MLLRPLTHEPKRSAGDLAFQNFTGFDRDERLAPLVLDVEVRRSVAGVLHADVDVEEEGDDGHGGPRRFLRACSTLCNGRLDLNQSFPSGGLRSIKVNAIADLAAAKATDLAFSQLFLLRADEVIQ